ncbi:hypothetical protein L207DRAFT_517611 [Hyaloscypha variabilis F]|uniref:Uncharacterized protein n=1 Tax=Hyaloscypha variabilis (strain UAMH 11265 / GT02V1 / F) TaxID=1149755 RepID=A0A2J6R7H6_HYAVF|nr:hypothetical protein L207DRAFT_517611 [Hyaloscypha variabilis F]
MVAPEFVLGKAIGDFVAAWKLKQKMEPYAIEDNVEWGLSHGFFAMMGGFRATHGDDEAHNPIISEMKEKKSEIEEHEIEEHEIEEHEIKERETEEREIEERPKSVGNDIEKFETHGQAPRQNLDQTPSVNPGPIPAPKIDGQDIVDSHIISGEHLYRLRSARDEVDASRDHEYIEKLPGITAAEIHDKGKSNAFTKVVAILQVFWISVQVIVRRARGLTISQLELVTAAFSLCAIITYSFLIQKPQGVDTPARPIKVNKGVKLPPLDSWFPLRAFFYPLDEEIVIKKYLKTRVANDFVDDKMSVPYSLGMALGGIIFGAVHVAGWNLSFPSSVDQELWRISSILMTVLLPVSCLPLIMLGFNDNSLDFLDALPWSPVATVQVWGCIFGAFYIVTRLILLVETFRTLAFLPPDAFVSTWVSNVPNVS